VLFLLTGSAGSGKSAVLGALSARRHDLALLDLDDLRPPAEADSSWWREQIEAHVSKAVEEQAVGRDTVLAGWIAIEEVLASPSSAALKDVAVCLLDCDDDVRIERVEQRAASGMWRTHTRQELEGFLRAAAKMRAGSGPTRLRIDTSQLSVAEVADRLEAWMADQHDASRDTR
jgi:adenylylsulfate kinase-like enzyme